MTGYRFRHALVAVLLFVALLSQGTWALASTTGGMSGTVTAADTGAPIANAKVTVSSPSQTVVGQTDATGRFTFISLSPDTYTVSLEKDGFQPASTPGVTVFADATQTLALTMQSALKTIVTQTSRAGGSLVKSGTTADVYSINASTQDKISGLGGGGSLNSAYSAIASVPGAFVPLNQTGYFQTVHIRGGDYDQVGYELDGVPVNRSFDNYPSGAASSLGQQELQVYTGASPANSEGQGLAGFINQVIKTGTYPGFGTAYLGLGGPSFYHKLAVEVGGATPNRSFSYYFGIGGYNQGFRYVDNNNASGYGDLGAPLATDGNPGGFIPAPYQLGFLSDITDRDVVANLHFALQHKNDDGHDDVQLLWNSGMLHNSFYGSTNDQGGDAYLNLPSVGVGTPTYSDGYQWTCGRVGTTTNNLSSSCVSNYLYPGSSQQRAFGAAIPADARDTIWNNQEVVKLQYQKNIGTDAYFRLYGYTYYSDWLQNGPQCAYGLWVCGASPDYELSSHTRGLAASFSKQLNAQNLVSIQGNYTTASTLRDNNTQMFNGGGTRSRGVVLVDSTNPYNGLCYTAAGVAVTCSPQIHAADFQTWHGIQSSGAPGVTAPAAVCGGGPCTWLIAENSNYATYNTVKPIFTSLSITDEFRPNDKWLFNLGLRQDTFEFDGADTRANDPARAFWYTAYNRDTCINAVGAPTDKSNLGLAPTAACPAGYTAANLVNSSAQKNTYTVFQPRLSGTYTLNADTVIRFSGGKYAEPPNAAFEQYDTLQEDSPFTLLGVAFTKFGFNTPSHQVRPPTSLNYDLSLEKHFKGTDISFKLTPFVRKTKDQIQQFFLDQQSGFVSGLNVGRQTSEGFEFQLNKGDFSRNGLSGQLSFAYTHSYINYDVLNNGTTLATGINNDIKNYNAYTSFCASNPSNAKCGTTSTGATAAACYTPAGVADPGCAAGDIANPYWNAPAQGLVDPNQNFPTYDLFPGPIGSAATTYGAPYVGTLILNYKHDKWAVTPSLQFVGGARYGSPETNAGIDPASGCTALASSTTGDPRYPYGAAGGSPFDSTGCGGNLNAIPNSYTGTFDPLGAFLQPSQIIGNVQVSYEVSPKLSLVGTFANVLNRCWGGTKAAWTINDSNVCSYGLVAGGFQGGVGNVYNPGDTLERGAKYPYGAYLGAVNVDGNSTKTPFNFFIEARIKL